MVKRIISALAVVAAMVGAVGLLQTNSANATVVVADKVEICHRDNNVKKPYGPKKIEVSTSAIFTQGHSGHNGPIATSEAVAQALKDNHDDWGDIIPPFNYKIGNTTFTYPGKNWTTAGQAIWNNDCQYVVDPEGEAAYSLKCQEITLSAPTGVKPEGASYQYYIDGNPVGLGSHSVTAGGHVITLKVNGTLVDTDEVAVEKCERPQGKSHYKVYCEAIKLKSPWYVKPNDAQYQYYIDGTPASLGMNEVNKGWHVVVLKVNGKVVDFDWVYVKECKEEPKPADVSVTLVCDPVTNKFNFTIRNDGEASAEVMFNDETFTLDGGKEAVRTLDGGGTLTLKVDGEVYVTEGGEKYENKVFVSCQGQGSTGTPVTGGQGAATGVVSLPNTGSAAGQIASLIALIASVAAVVGGYVWRNRTASSL